MKNAPVRHRIEQIAYLTLKGFLRALPHTGARSFGRGIGLLAWALDGRHRRVAEGNMAQALPEVGTAERRRLVRDCFRHFGAALCDTISSTRFDPVEICRHFTLEGWENLEAADRRGQGVFILSAHVGFWELVPPVVALYRGAMSIVVRPADNPYLDRELRALRERFGNEVVPKRGAARKMLERLRAGGRVGILIDQRVQPKEGIEVPFFGRPAQTSPVLARLSLRTGAAVVPVAAFPEPGGRYRLIARPAILPPEGAKDDDATVAALTRRYLEVAEEDIRKHPAQWLWMHRRWR
ncbi:MAG TPA: lysophospholipid acyltransferase family protein [Thermoanaerobaculia bacterium]|nr:lysophospholipid acyltransferase family protein [Thermoanaerobaculia bacterium]